MELDSAQRQGNEPTLIRFTLGQVVRKQPWKRSICETSFHLGKCSFGPFHKGLVRQRGFVFRLHQLQEDLNEIKAVQGCAEPMLQFTMPCVKPMPRLHLLELAL